MPLADRDQVDTVRASVSGSVTARRPPGAVLVLAGLLFVTGTGLAAVIGSSSDAAGRGPAPAVARDAADAGNVARAAAGPAAVPPPAGSARSAGADTRADAADPVLALARARAVEPLLAVRADAVRARRPAGWTSPLDPRATVFVTRQRLVLDRILRVAPTGWRYEVVGTEPAGEGTGSAGPQAFVAHVRLRYRLAADTRDVERDQYFTVVPRSGRWYLAGDQDPRAEPAPWDLGELTVLRGRRSLVIGIDAPGASRLREIARATDAAAREVDAVWGTRWPRTAVVLVPGSRRLMAAALGRPDEAALDQVAAMTSGELDRERLSRRGVADRVVLNPDPYFRLTDLGRRVVLTHELTHVATRATARAPAPLWVEEGFANYVAYRSAGLAPALVASDTLVRVRSGTATHHLPDADAFDPARSSIAAAYADSWLAFRWMEEGGAGRPLAFYRAATGLTPGTAASGNAADGVGSTGGALDLAFRRVLGTTQGGFEAGWRTYRARLAAVP